MDGILPLGLGTLPMLLAVLTILTMTPMLTKKNVRISVLAITQENLHSSIIKALIGLKVTQLLHFMMIVILKVNKQLVNMEVNMPMSYLMVRNIESRLLILVEIMIVTIVVAKTRKEGILLTWNIGLS